MPPDEARKQKSQLRYLFIVDSFIEPYVVSVTRHYGPKFPDMLRDTTARFVTAVAKLGALWLYNYETGKIIEKIAPCTIPQDEDGRHFLF